MYLLLQLMRITPGAVRKERLSDMSELPRGGLLIRVGRRMSMVGMDLYIGLLGLRHCSASVDPVGQHGSLD